MFEDKKERNLALYKKHKIPFIKMIEYLLPPSLELEGCEVIFPHSAFFGDEGKPAFICQTDQDGKLVSITQQNKLALQEIRQSFSGFVRKRNSFCIFINASDFKFNFLRDRNNFAWFDISVFPI